MTSNKAVSFETIVVSTPSLTSKHKPSRRGVLKSNANIFFKFGSTVLDPRSKPVGPRRRKPERRVTKRRGRRVDTSRRRHFFRDEEICVTRLSSLQMRQSPQRVRRGCRNGPRTLGKPFLFLNLRLAQDFVFYFYISIYILRTPFEI